MKNNLILLLIVIFSLSVKGQTVYKTPSGAKYHRSTCRMVENVSEALTLNTARETGLTACKICNPPKATTTNSFYQKSTKAKGEATTVQCKGTTKKGTRCKHKTSIANGYCYQHNPD